MSTKQPDTQMRFNLYINPNASEALRVAHRRYVQAMEASWRAEGEDAPASWRKVEHAKRLYGAALLQEDRAQRPQAYGRS